VVVPAGIHTVELVYRPLAVYLGAALSIVGLLGCLGLVLWGGRTGPEAAPWPGRET